MYNYIYFFLLQYSISITSFDKLHAKIRKNPLGISNDLHKNFIIKTERYSIKKDLLFIKHNWTFEQDNRLRVCRGTLALWSFPIARRQWDLLSAIQGHICPIIVSGLLCFVSPTRMDLTCNNNNNKNRKRGFLYVIYFSSLLWML